MINAHILFKFTALFYAMGLVVVTLRPPSARLLRLILLPAMGANFAVVAWRYWQAWPMLPMYLGPVTLPLALTLLLCADGQAAGEPVVGRFLVGVAALLALMGVCFPKDFYLPFLKSATPLAHLFLVFGTIARACFLCAAAWALAGLLPNRAGFRSASNHFQRAMRWTVWGFGLATLSMFAGELWSYLGWGTPVVWDEPAITIAMATWFFYICLLHLHLTGSWSARSRGIYTATGAVVIIALNSLPDLGPFRWPL